MHTLLGLPNEILDHIVNDLHIDDIEAFASSCKRIKLLAACRLKRHLVKKYQFPSIAIELEPTGVDEFSDHSFDDREMDHIPTHLLPDFLMDDENTLYPRSMSIGNTSTILDDNEELRELRRALVTTYIEDYHGLENKIVAKVLQIQNSLFAETPAIEAQYWIDRIKNGDPDATAALLVALFPNVKTLSMCNRRALEAESLLVRTLEKLTSAAAKIGPRALDAFTELSEIEFDNPHLRHLQRPGGPYEKLIAMFMILPTMRVIKGRRVHLLAFNWPYGSVASSVKEISMLSSHTEAASLANCLRHIESLERLTYDMVPPNQYTMRSEPRLIVKALRKYARRTLVHLELTGGVSDISSDPTDGEPFIGTLRSFQVLQSIRLTTTMLFKPVNGAEVDESEDIALSTPEDSVHPTALVEPRRLVDFLPSSARIVELVGGLSNEEARDMFEDLPKLKSERLPNLVEIVLEDCEPLEQETKDLCKHAGIRLKSIKRVVNGYQRIYAITKPAPQVDEREN